MQGSTYKSAGVDIAAADALIERIKPHAAATRRPGVMGGLGGFGALFDLKATGYADPILVSGTDGVGTKLKVAIATGDHSGVGADLVAMCVNDVLVQGAEPLFFLDYFATGRLEPAVAEAVVASVARGCAAAGCALVGGEVAELPGMYADGDYDLAGFCVGAVERGDLIDGSKVAEGDVLLGLESDGLHATGFSLVRKIIEGMDLAAPAPWDARLSLGAALLAPTRIYVRPVLGAIKAHPGAVHAMAHITGGGIVGNLSRVIPGDLSARVETGAWPRPAVLTWLIETGGVEERDAWSTWNMGLGMVLVVCAGEADAVAGALRGAGERVHAVGRVEAGPDRVRLVP
ncbi:MAG TPA: phosphoribosylformylglycinamidine cyclo-ligase [Rhodospirillaceae bacterium]|mgnify:CR=1 FL=1|jgi:phosphoribosylformylglycinamidine cyclo-ligase|nr:phosphoribosylformylglycinamidine cyclo-ligase [Alphaproteobacteria bacterium]HBH26873.1 phosphoribosylformylglycinamidine cyclo-ligase [Rhodospirillaceae bacterium]